MMVDDTKAWPRCSTRTRMALLAAAAAGTALLAAACGGGPHPASPGAAPSQRIVQNMAAFAHCMRSHGEPDFYYASPFPQSPPPDTLQFGPGYAVTGIDTHTAVFTSAMKSCRHLDTIPPPPPTSRQQLAQERKADACIRAHGYPGWPDPVVQDGRAYRVPAPASINTTSPRFQAVWNACYAKA
jgi:hypothetical protein